MGWGWFRAAEGSALPWEPFPGAGQQAVGLLCLLAAPHKPWDAVHALGCRAAEQDFPGRQGRSLSPASAQGGLCRAGGLPSDCFPNNSTPETQPGAHSIWVWGRGLFTEAFLWFCHGRALCRGCPEGWGAPAGPSQAESCSAAWQYCPNLWETPPTLLPMTFESVLKHSFLCSSCSRG